MIFAELDEVLDPDPHEGAWNMALDEVLLRTVSRPTLRWYRWSASTLSLGYFDKWQDLHRQWPGHALVRRWTGGGLVPHGADLTYTLVVPRAHPFARLPAGESYRQVHVAVAAALRLGAADVSLSDTTVRRVSAACFENAAQHDVVARGGKIAGAAQRRTRHGLLHQGSVQMLGLGADFAQRLQAELGERGNSCSLSAEMVEAADQLTREKYGTAAWLQRF